MFKRRIFSFGLQGINPVTGESFFELGKIFGTSEIISCVQLLICSLVMRKTILEFVY